MVRDGVKSDAKAYWILALVTPAQKSGKDDVKLSEIPPRWPPILRSGGLPNPTYEVTSVDASSIAFVVNRILKVG